LEKQPRENAAVIHELARGRQPQSWRKVAQLGILALLGVGLSGCAGLIYAIDASAAESSLETARTLEAEKYAPYEYYYALAHLEKASEEAASADYQDAIRFATTAEEYADKAIERARDAQRSAGR
jgi:hypothetical protein